MSYFLPMVAIPRILCGTEQSRPWTVAELRRSFPGVSQAYPKLGPAQKLELLERLKAGERFPAKVLKVAGPKPICSLSRAEILACRAAGESLKSIALKCGVSYQRVSQISRLADATAKDLDFRRANAGPGAS